MSATDGWFDVGQIPIIGEGCGVGVEQLGQGDHANLPKLQSHAVEHLTVEPGKAGPYRFQQGLEGFRPLAGVNVGQALCWTSSASTTAGIGSSANAVL